MRAKSRERYAFSKNFKVLVHLQIRKWEGFPIARVREQSRIIAPPFDAVRLASRAAFHSTPVQSSKAGIT